MAELEKVVKAAIKSKILELWPDAWHLMVVPTGFGQGGVPDHIACVPVTVTPEMVGKTYGMFISDEAKTESGVVSKLQRVQIANIVKASGFVAVTKGVRQVPELEEKLRKRFCLK